MTASAPILSARSGKHDAYGGLQVLVALLPHAERICGTAAPRILYYTPAPNDQKAGGCKVLHIEFEVISDVALLRCQGGAGAHGAPVCPRHKAFVHRPLRQKTRRMRALVMGCFRTKSNGASFYLARQNARLNHRRGRILMPI